MDNGTADSIYRASKRGNFCGVHPSLQSYGWLLCNRGEKRGMMLPIRQSSMPPMLVQQEQKKRGPRDAVPSIGETENSCVKLILQYDSSHSTVVEKKVCQFIPTLRVEPGRKCVNSDSCFRNNGQSYYR